ncbi:hypothetical protein Tsubulata_004303 [Turnera subulata]|uniref:F-box domain-containing protein n=1 Tax=Turnera subulata TaxID=218843 RepID=A0A9Q0J1K6_9ROSI|nr:hypothetical protein Tsubulata_004303 [Turnera subulata]
MKLKFRCQQTGATTTVSRNDIRTFQDLKDIFSQSSGHPASSVVLSLNRRDELDAPSPDASLQSLGIVSGDIIYYSRRTHDPSPSPQTLTAIPYQATQGNLPAPVSDQSLNSVISGSNLNNSDGTHEPGYSMQESETQEMGLLGQVESGTVGGMDIDGEDEGEDADVDGEGFSRFSEPYFLRKVLREGFSGGGRDRNLLVAAIHAVFLESGFVRVDSVSDRFEIPEEWPSRMSFSYTLPELVSGEGVVQSAVLKFQVLGRFVNVYGSLANGGSGQYRLCLDESRFSRTLNLVWANCYENVRMAEEDASSKSNTEREVFEFWKTVKDGLALPLLIDLCVKAGLLPPACMMLLPAELKLMILQLLPGVDVARMGCVCSELRYLSSNTDLWKKKYEEEFGSGSGANAVANWKDKFASSWESRKKRKEFYAGRTQPYLPFRMPYVRRDPDPFGFIPGMIGGDYDRLPGFGVPPPLRQPGQGLGPFRRRNFGPTGCNLGGSNF